MSISIAAYESMIEKLVDCQSALAAERARAETLKQQAEIWAQEARTQKATVHEIYQLCTGSTGEPGDWNGANPVREVIARAEKAEAEAARLRAEDERVRVVFFEFIQDWKKGDFSLSTLAALDVQAIQDVYERIEAERAALAQEGGR